MHTGFWWGNPEGKRLLARPRYRWEDNIKLDLQEVQWGAWTGLIWLRIGTVEGIFSGRNEPCFHKMQGIF